MSLQQLDTCCPTPTSLTQICSNQPELLFFPALFQRQDSSCFHRVCVSHQSDSSSLFFHKSNPFKPSVFNPVEHQTSTVQWRLVKGAVWILYFCFNDSDLERNGCSSLRIIRTHSLPIPHPEVSKPSISDASTPPTPPRLQREVSQLETLDFTSCFCYFCVFHFN